MFLLFLSLYFIVYLVLFKKYFTALICGQYARDKPNVLCMSCIAMRMVGHVI